KPLPHTIRPSSPTAEVIRLANSGIEDSVMMTFVTNSTGTFNLGAEQIIYLKDIGVPDAVVTAMIQRDQMLRALSTNTLTATIHSPPIPTNFPTLSPSEVAPQPDPSAPPYAVEAPLTPEPIADNSGFYDALAPYGTWVDVGGYGMCWQPTVVAVNTAWQPYSDCGRWVYTDCGWYWHSGYSWGWAPFHYGRWFQHHRLGWCWAPDTIWGPSWVSW